MKRFLQILTLLIVLILAAIIILPIAFKDEIIAKVEEEINNNLEATVNFGDINLSLFRSFPDFSLSIEKFTVDGKGTFEGVRLAEIGDFQVDIDLLSVISGSQFQIEGINLKDAQVHVIIDTAGNANYDIAKSSGAEKEPAATESDPASSSFKLLLKKYSIENFNLVYDDQKGKLKAVINDLDHSGKGDFSQDIVNLLTNTSIAELTVENGGIAYFNKVNLNAKMDFEFNQPQSRLSFGENELNLNDLKLAFTGSIAFPGDDINLDFKFKAPETKFKSILSLVPAIYTQDFDKVQTSGSIAVEAEVKGTYNAEREEYPPFNFKLEVIDGAFRYPDLPAGVDNINIEFLASNKEKDLDGIMINVPKANASVAGNKINSYFRAKRLLSDPAFEGALKTDLDLANLGKVVPAEGFDYQGKLLANLEVQGRMSAIENERYDEVKAEGTVGLTDISLKSDSLPYSVQITQAQAEFTPRMVNLNSFEAKLGESDISANGKIDNIFSYIFKEEVLKADFNLNSGLLDLNELSGGGEGETTETTNEEIVTDTSSAIQAIRIPQNIDFQLTASLKEVRYSNLKINNLKGRIALKEGRAALEDVVMKLLNGSVAMNGFYNSKPAAPVVDMNIKVNKFGFKESYASFVTIQKLAPIMETATGSYSMGMTFQSTLNPDMTPDLASVEASGILKTFGLSASPQSFKQLAGIVKNPSLATLNIGNVDISFKIENGRLSVEPFDVKAGNVTAVVQGSNGLDQSLDYRMDMKLPVKGIGAEGILNQLGAASGGKVDLAVNIGGTVTDPKVTTSLGDLGQTVIDNVKQAVEEKIEEVKQEAIDEVNKKAEELIAEAERQGDALIAQAQTQADAIRAEAAKRAQQIRDEADKQAKKLEDEAKGNFLKEAAAKEAAKKLRDEAAKNANKVEQEADQKARKLVDEARKKKEQLVQEARDKGKVGG